MSSYVEQDLFGSIAITNMTIDELMTIRAALQEKSDTTSLALVGKIDSFLKAQRR